MGHRAFHFIKATEVFGAPRDQLTDDEKFLWKISNSQTAKFGRENAKDMLHAASTRAFIALAYIGEMYSTICEVQAGDTTRPKIFGLITLPTSESIFPHSGVPSFSVSFHERAPNVPCLIPCAIDRDRAFA